MIVLYLLAAHMVGDFVLQSRWQAADKLEDRMVRLDHCATYLVPFVVVVLATGHDWRAFYAFPACLFALHFLTDSKEAREALADLEPLWEVRQDTGRS